ncbi:MAG: Glutamine synthetase [Candidatus Midichloria mitochondrii]|uniref:Glutamine synthetase type I n=1 Tax=Midichloria mitochondrii (strain IricVA) TaxID=696127 RepID=F7XTV1_MIDMI|nr:glutamine synthetase type I [Candidatus Midichloria mitochondrii]AEI89310.1 glutamine synthetase type I [Candidatus Midichloria mitochondrii IricVA]MDJ1256621.1 glutamine synthetase [Candidatus Midichloria mitochondrii]MDJ1288358.1 glutamine synthetase [Candidatus Midichloria mitochondrii]MDJ1299194.1 glutamine synthetase [Candidatus Midichloria mitochondrii]MDJ1313310.1 glutamine synthetase [Candidatus Midichloria mitochondrii]
MFNFLEKGVFFLDKNEQFDFITFRFFDIFGAYQDVTYSAHYFSDDFLQNNAVIASSSSLTDCVSNKKIYLKPNLNTFFPDLLSNAIIIHCNIVVKSHEGVNLYDNLNHDPRYLASRTDSYLLNSMKIDQIAFLIELEFYADIEDDLEDEFYNNLKSSFEKSNVELVSYRKLEEPNKRLVGTFSLGILNTADTIEKVKYLLKKIGVHYQVVVSFESDKKHPARIIVNHVIYQNNRSIFHLNNFFTPTEEVTRYIGGIFYNYDQIIDLSKKLRQTSENLRKIKFYYAEALPSLKDHCKVMVNDLYISIDLPAQGVNSYILLASLIIYGIDGIYEKIECNELDMGQGILDQSLDFSSPSLTSFNLIHNVMGEEIVDLYKKV